MRWLLVVPLAVVVALAGWLIVAERERDVRERTLGADPEPQPVEVAARETDDAPASPPENAAVGLVQGEVRGRHGGIWGVRVVAYAAGGKRALAESSTGPDGHYALELPVGALVDLVLEPGAETGLEKRTRGGIVVPAVVDFAFGHSTRATGRLRCLGWTRYDGIDLMAVPEERFAGWDDPAGLRPAAATHLLMTTGEAPFTFEGLAPGAYRLVVADFGWMLREPVRFTADADAIDAVAVRAFGVQLRVEDAALSVPVGRFTVQARFDANEVLTWEGRGGFLRRRVPHPMPPERHRDGFRARKGSLRITSPGYFPEELPLGPMSGRVRLRPLRDRSVFLRVRYEDGADCPRPLRAEAWCEGVDPFDVGIERGADGSWTASLPPGAWTMAVWCDDVTLPRRAWLDLEVPVDGEVRRELAVGRTGTVVLHGELNRIVCIAPVLENGRSGGLVELALESTVHECRLPPGRYRLYASSRREPDADFDLQADARIHVNVLSARR